MCSRDFLDAGGHLDLELEHRCGLVTALELSIHRLRVKVMVKRSPGQHMVKRECHKNFNIRGQLEQHRSQNASSSGR
jgi:hypothetical protein